MLTLLVDSVSPFRTSRCWIETMCRWSEPGSRAHLRTRALSLGTRRLHWDATLWWIATLRPGTVYMDDAAHLPSGPMPLAPPPAPSSPVGQAPRAFALGGRSIGVRRLTLRNDHSRVTDGGKFDLLPLTSWPALARVQSLRFVNCAPWSIVGLLPYMPSLRTLQFCWSQCVSSPSVPVSTLVRRSGIAAVKDTARIPRDESVPTTYREHVSAVLRTLGLLLCGGDADWSIEGFA